MKYLDSAYTINERTRHAQAEWHDVVLSICRCAAVFRESGNSPREADQMYSYITTFALHAARHLDRLSNTNGHNKDSTPATEQGQAPAFETGACVDGDSHEATGVPPCAAPVTVAVPGNDDRDVEGKIQLLIDQLGDLMAKNRDHQPYEVALKIAHRGRTLAREGKFVLAVRQLRAATNAAHGLKLEVF